MDTPTDKSQPTDSGARASGLERGLNDAVEHNQGKTLLQKVLDAVDNGDGLELMAKERLVLLPVIGFDSY